MKDAEMFQIKIEPFKVYQKYASQDYVLCGISFNFSDDDHCYRSECNNNCLLEILSEIDDYFDGRIAISYQIGVLLLYHGVQYNSIADK